MLYHVRDVCSLSSQTPDSGLVVVPADCLQLCQSETSILSVKQSLYFTTKESSYRPHQLTDNMAGHPMVSLFIDSLYGWTEMISNGMTARQGSSYRTKRGYARAQLFPAVPDNISWLLWQVVCRHRCSCDGWCHEYNQLQS